MAKETRGLQTEMADPSGANRLPRGLRPALRMSTALGFAGGFLMAYQRSSYRFWGWSENVRFPSPPIAIHWQCT